MLTRYVRGRAVSAIGLGGANLSLRPDRDDEKSIRLIHQAVEAGITLIDTARAYTTADESEHNERLVARAVDGLGPAREHLTVSTKGGHVRSGDRFPIDGSPDALRRDCEASLRALGADSLDLYLLHHPDPAVPIEDSVGALDALRTEGKVRLVGVSNVSRDQYRRAASVCIIDAVENELSPYAPADRDFARMLASDGVAYLAYSPLGGASRRTKALPETFSRVALDRGVSPEQVVLAWELALAPTVVPIIGATRRTTLLDCVAAGSLDLTGDEITALGTSVS